MTYDPATLPAAYTHTPLETLEEADHPTLHEVDREQIRGIRGEMGISPTSGDLLAYVRLGDNVGGTTGKGLLVPAAALTLPPLAFNGGFLIWQGGTSTVSIGDGSYAADGWAYRKIGAMVHDVSRSTDVPSVTALHPTANYSMLVDCTTVDSSIAASDMCLIEHHCEGFYWAPFHQRAFVIPFWVKATKTGTYCVALINSGQDRSYVAEYTVNASDTWEFKTIVVSASPSAGTWDLTTGLGIRIAWCLASGTDWHTTAGAWQTGLKVATSSQVNACDNTANNFRLAMVRPNLGTVALPFSPVGPEMAKMIAERYVQVLEASSANTVFASGKVTTSTAAEFALKYRRMRAVPTVSVSTASDFQVDDNSVQACSALSGDLIGFDSLRLSATVASGLTGGRGCLLRANSTTSAKISLLARI